MGLFIFPSRTDSFGNVVLEALASGAPAVVAEAAGRVLLFAMGERVLWPETCSSS
jgi:phosphatidylinositol alpha 1,6-mannosyltransferase